MTMRRHDIITKDATTGALVESFIVSEKSARTLKAANIPGLIAITNSARCTHPSPAIMCAALASMGVDLAKFYGACETIRASEDAPTEDEDESGEE